MYLFGQECKAAVFTWLGCTIEMSTSYVPISPRHIYHYEHVCTYLLSSTRHVTGHPSVEYISDETPMSVYANVYLALEQMRVRALAAVHGSPVPEDEGDDAAGTDPPRVLVLGPENSGKTTVCKILTNYAVRSGQDWVPTDFNVDPSEVCSVPRSVVCLLTCVFVAHIGRLECPRSDIRGTYHRTDPDVLPCVRPWFHRDLCPEPRLVECAASSVILVWARGDAAKSPPHGPAHPESWREHPRQV